MELALATPANKKIEVSATTFGREFNEPLVHQVVTAFLAGGRSGTKAQKTRSDVRGGGAKPWRQKGTGRARAGTTRSPIWVGGGRAFAAAPRDHSQKVNKKMFRGAMRSILSELVRQQRLVVVDSFTMEQPKTKSMVEKLGGLGCKEALVLLDQWDSNVYLSARNIPGVEVRVADKIDPVSLVRFEKVIMTEAAVRKLEEVLG